jgi:hypothetical protein
MQESNTFITAINFVGILDVITVFCTEESTPDVKMDESSELRRNKSIWCHANVMDWIALSIYYNSIGVVVELQSQRPILNFTPGGKLWPPGVKLSVCPSILINNRECSPLGVNKGVNFTPRGQISPLGARGEVKNGPLHCRNLQHFLPSSWGSIRENEWHSPFLQLPLDNWPGSVWRFWNLNLKNYYWETQFHSW